MTGEGNTELAMALNRHCEELRSSDVAISASDQVRHCEELRSSDVAIQPTSMAIQAEEFRRLKWRARRGMLENDLLLERFFEHWGDRMTHADHDGLARLLDLSDNDLLDLLVGRVQPEGDLDLPEVRSVLEKIQANQA